MKNKSFLYILHILPGDISFYPEPIYNNELLDSNEKNIFKSKEILLIHLKVTSLLPKINEICCIAECTNAVVTGVTEFMFDKSIFLLKIQIDNYDLL